jgi:hypothetical protein
LRKWERDHSSVCEEYSLREDLEGRLASGGWQLEAHWGGGNFLWASEGAALSKIGGSSKAAQIPEEGNGSWERERAGWGGGGQESKVSVRNAPDPSHSTKMLGKMPLTKKAHKKSLTSKRKV